MPSTNGGHYDQNLLASAPVATKSQLQEGYNPDLLNEAAKPPPKDIESGHASKEYLGTQTTPIPPRVPFWRTTRGVVIIAVAAVVVVGAVVGGAVGGTVGKKKGSADGSLSTGGAAGSDQQAGSDSPSQSASNGLSALLPGATATTSSNGPAPSQQSTESSAQTAGNGNGNGSNPPAAGAEGNRATSQSTGAELAGLGDALTPPSTGGVLGVDSLS